jgi:hypothetical protein
MIWEDIKAELLALLRVLFGLANAIAAGFFLYLEAHPGPAKTSHIAMFLGWLALGLAITWPSVVIGTAKQLIALIPEQWIPPALQKKTPSPGGAP